MLVDQNEKRSREGRRLVIEPKAFEPNFQGERFVGRREKSETDRDERRIVQSIDQQFVMNEFPFLGLHREQLDESVVRRREISKRFGRVNDDGERIERNVPNGSGQRPVRFDVASKFLRQLSKTRPRKFLVDRHRLVPLLQNGIDGEFALLRFLRRRSRAERTIRSRHAFGVSMINEISVGRTRTDQTFAVLLHRQDAIERTIASLTVKVRSQQITLLHVQPTAVVFARGANAAVRIVKFDER